MDWFGDESYVFENPSREMAPDADALKRKYSRHIWLQTSGTTSAPKWIGLAKDAFLASAKSVNSHLQLNIDDVWLNPLPVYHVGGLAVHARAAAGGFRAVDLGLAKWNVEKFVQKLTETRATVTSLVPTQVFDLVTAGVRAPAMLKCVVVGGGRLHDGLRQRARELGWPLFPSYGLTECCSQVATARSADDPSLVILSHVQTKVMDGRLALKSPALFSAWARFDGGNWEFSDPKVDGWFLTEDFAEISKQDDVDVLIPLGRLSDRVKIAGELVSVSGLEEKLNSVAERLNISATVKLQAIPHERWENQIVLLGERLHSEELRALADAFNREVLPIERIQSVHSVDRFERTELGKIKTLTVS